MKSQQSGQRDFAHLQLTSEISFSFNTWVLCNEAEFAEAYLSP